MGRRASDNSEGKEVSDSTEKYASDGSEGSEAYEHDFGSGVDPNKLSDIDSQQLAQLYKTERSPFDIFQF